MCSWGDSHWLSLVLLLIWSSLNSRYTEQWIFSWDCAADNTRPLFQIACWQKHSVDPAVSLLTDHPVISVNTHSVSTKPNNCQPLSKNRSSITGDQWQTADAASKSTEFFPLHGFTFWSRDFGYSAVTTFSISQVTDRDVLVEDVWHPQKPHKWISLGNNKWN